MNRFLLNDDQLDLLASLHHALIKELERRLTSNSVAEEGAQVLEVARKMLAQEGITSRSLDEANQLRRLRTGTADELPFKQGGDGNAVNLSIPFNPARKPN